MNLDDKALGREPLTPSQRTFATRVLLHLSGGNNLHSLEYWLAEGQATGLSKEQVELLLADLQGIHQDSVPTPK